MAEVRLEGVTRRYGEVTAVHELNLTVHDREFVSLLGPSGCGKSTILNMIAGLIPISEGSIYIDGVRVNDLAPKDRGIAMVFQDYALYPHMSVYENLAFPLKALKLPSAEIRSKVQEAAEILGITELLERPPKALSGGQRQRVALGRAIVRRPKVFLMDEPLSNLDARLRLNMRAEIKRLHHRLAATMIYVTHDQAEAMTLSSRIAVLSRGRLQQFATPLEMYDWPCNRFVGEFMGNMPMNFLDCTLAAHNGAVRVDAGDFVFTSSYLRQAVPQERFGERLTLGIRAENVVLAAGGEPGAFPAEVEVLEQLGSDLFVYARVGEQRVLVRAAPSVRLSEGDRVHLRFIDEHFRVFNQTGNSLN